MENDTIFVETLCATCESTCKAPETVSKILAQTMRGGLDDAGRPSEHVRTLEAKRTAVC